MDYRVPQAAERDIRGLVDVDQSIEVAEHGAGLSNCRHCEGFKENSWATKVCHANSCFCLHRSLGLSVSLTFSEPAFKISLAMSLDAKLDAIPNVQIDEGLFKYVLIKVYGQDAADGKETFKFIVRGFERAEWHGEWTTASG